MKPQENPISEEHRTEGEQTAPHNVQSELRQSTQEILSGDTGHSESLSPHKREATILLGEGLLLRHKTEEAIEAFRRAGHIPVDQLVAYAEKHQYWHDAWKALEYAGRKDKLLELGKWCLDNPAYGPPWFEVAKNAFEKGDAPPDTWERFGETALNAGRIDDAVIAYEKAGQEVPKEKTLAIAKEILLTWQVGEKNTSVNFALAKKYYAAVGEDLPEELLLAHANRVSPWQLIALWEETKAPGLKNILIRHADAMLQRSSYLSFDHRYIQQMYQYADAPIEKQKHIAQRLIEVGEFDKGIKLAKEFGMEIPKKSYEETGDRYISESTRESGGPLSSKRHKILQAIEAYKLAGAAEKIQNIGDNAMIANPSDLHMAFHAYEALNAVEELRKVGEKAHAMQTFHLALAAFKLVGDTEKLASLGEMLTSNKYLENILMNTYEHRESAFRNAIQDGIQAFVAANKQSRAIAIGDTYLRSGNYRSLEIALDCYRRAGARGKMLEVARIFLESCNDVPTCQKIYKELKIPMPRELLVLCGNKYVSMEKIGEAKKFYTQAARKSV